MPVHLVDCAVGRTVCSLLPGISEVRMRLVFALQLHRDIDGPAWVSREGSLRRNGPGHSGDTQ